VFIENVGGSLVSQIPMSTAKLGTRVTKSVTRKILL